MPYLVSILIGIMLLYVSPTHAGQPEYPGQKWATKTPNEVGMDVAKLNEFSQFVGGRGCVVRHGYMIYSWGDVSRREDVASACKPFFSHFLFKAIESGKIKSVEEKAVKWEPRLSEINQALGFKDREIRWRHFANQTSCYQLVEKPGAAYAYNDWQMALFWDTLFLKVYEATYDNVDEKVFRPLLTEPLQCQDNPTMMAFGTKNRPGRVGISVRDFARFGLLYLRQGNWRGRQLIRREHATIAVANPLPNSIPRAGRKAAEMIAGQRTLGSRDRPDNQTDHFGSYSWLWWINGVDRDGTRFWPSAPHDTFGAFGHGGPRAMWVIPSLDIVVSYNDAKLRGWRSGEESPTNQAMKRLVAAIHHKDGKQDYGQFAKWSKIEIAFTGPNSRGRGQPNPFAVRLDVTFTGPKGKRYRVPGFYDGNGKGDLDGNVWKVRFSADALGSWEFKTTSDHKSLDAKNGRFTVTKTPKQAQGFWKWGRLEAVGDAENKIRYLKLRDGPYWLKAGCDDPENSLGGYRHYNTLAERKAAIDYLAERGVNSFYIMTHNIGGDDKDVWPWLGKAPRHAMSHGAGDVRFDVAKLEQWRELFEYMQTRGVVPYLVLEDDSAWKGYNHRRYYREIIARFGYLPALIFNFGEEHNENYRLSQALEFMRQLQQLDPYDHPRGIHNVNRANNDYIDAEQIDFTSIQTGSPGSRKGLKNALEHNRIAIDWINRCRQRKRRILMVNFDEGRPEEDRRCWWSVYLAGGVWETHVRQPYDRPHSAWEPAWTQLGGARAFMESLPFWEMAPHNELVKDGRAFCLAKPGHVYALYLPTGGAVTVNLAPETTYEVAWWNTINGKDGAFQNKATISGGPKRLTAPGDGDWAVRISRKTARHDVRSNQ